MNRPHGQPGLPGRILFLNDVAFQYGAGIAQARQVEALLASGVEVGVLAWEPGGVTFEKVATGAVDPSLWRGLGKAYRPEGDLNLSDKAIIAGLLMEAARFRPEVVIVGNLHAARWPLQLLPELRSLGCRVIAFVHDAFLFTGRCAYPGKCELFLTGCTASCPTADEYPALEPALIPAAWHLRRQVFGGPNGIEVLTNSRWIRDLFRRAMPSAVRLETLELGADETAFVPGDKAAARRHLGLPGDKPIVLCAAVNFRESRKGGPQLRTIVKALGQECTFAAFGHNTAEIPGLVGLGYHIEAHRIALAYQAADLFLGTATEEAFGQTLMEAQLCGVPVVAFQTGGVGEIVRNEITGRLVPNGDATAAIAAIRAMLADSEFLRESAVAARQLAVERFSQTAHRARWAAYFGGYRQLDPGRRPPLAGFPPPPHPSPAEPEPYQPSWTDSPLLLAQRYAEISSRISALQGSGEESETAKVFEIGFQTGGSILEIAPFGSRFAVAALRGAEANPARTQPAQYCAIAAASQLGPMRAALLTEGLAAQCHLVMSDDLAASVPRWAANSTAIIINGTLPKPVLLAVFAAISASVPAGTMVFLTHFLDPGAKLRKPPARSAAEAWEAAGRSVFAGCFGRGALYTTRLTTT